MGFVPKLPENNRTFVLSVEFNRFTFGYLTAQANGRQAAKGRGSR